MSDALLYSYSKKNLRTSHWLLKLMLVALEIRVVYSFEELKRPAVGFV